MSEQESKPAADSQSPAGQSEAQRETKKDAKKGAKAPAKSTPKDAPSSATGQDAAPGQPPGRGRAGLWLALLALVMAIVAILGGGYLWTRQQALQDQLQMQQSELSSKVSALRGDWSSRADALQSRADQIAQAQQELRQSMESVRELAGRSRRDWLLAEVEYLLRIANRRLQLQRDVGTAMAVLQIADARLRELADPGLTEVRERIVRELDTLRATPRPDLEGIAVQLSSLVDQVPQLQVKAARAPARAALTGSEGASEPPPQAWREGLQRAWEALKRLVVIRRRDEPITPLLGPAHEFAVREGLRLQLEAARVALLRENEALYRSSIQGARDWMARYFVADNAPYDAMNQTLRQLGEQEIRVDLPDISASLRRLREIMTQRGLDTESAAQTGAAPAADRTQTQPAASGSADQQAPAAEVAAPAAESAPAETPPADAPGQAAPAAAEPSGAAQ